MRAEQLMRDAQVLQEEAGTGSSAAPTMLGTARKGYLHCQLQMGHLQGMLTQVDGFAQSTAGGLAS